MTAIPSLLPPQQQTVSLKMKMRRRRAARTREVREKYHPHTELLLVREGGNWSWQFLSQIYFSIMSHCGQSGHEVGTELSASALLGWTLHPVGIISVTEELVVPNTNWPSSKLMTKS